MLSHCHGQYRWQLKEIIINAIYGGRYLLAVGTTYIGFNFM